MKTSIRSGKLPSENRSAAPQKENSARKPGVRSGKENSVRNTKVRSGHQTFDPLPPTSIRKRKVPLKIPKASPGTESSNGIRKLQSTAGNFGPKYGSPARASNVR